MVLNHIYSRKTENGGVEYFWPEEVENTYDAKGSITGAKRISDGSPVQYGGIGSMSKSKNNGVDPQSLIDTMGADTARLFVMFASPPEQTLEWSDSGVEDANRSQIGRAHACTPVPHAHIVCRLLLDKKN